ncbi:MAG: DNA-packaging protein [Candidatus Eisenbacteria sp.]|nr:DNA-packaging protein [Candidatus Eisenbacteria bacterium]
MSSLTDERIEQLLKEAEADPKAAEALEYHWPLRARDDQLPPEGAWRIWQMLSGRGAGKTRAGSEQVIQWAQDEESPIALVGQTKADVRDTMIEIGPSSIIKRSPPWFMPDFEPSKRRLVWPNGVIAIVYSGDEPGQLRGPAHAKAWVDELAKFRYPEESLDNLEMGLRIGANPQWMSTTTPRPTKVIKDLVADPDCVNVVVSTFANAANLPAKFLARLIAKYEGTTLGRQELHGEIIDDIEGALWTRDIIDHVAKVPEMDRIIVGVDPGEDCTGIVVCGKKADQLYVLEDLSGPYTPSQWAHITVEAYDNHGANMIAAEQNHGGKMVEQTIRTVDKNVSIDPKVWASVGKSRRAEPIVSIYEQGRGHHVGHFAELEDQMCQWIRGATRKEMGWSPDHMDAMVWAATKLMLKPSTKMRVVEI